MSDVLFQCEGGVAGLSASERARAATLVDDLALGLLGVHRPAVARRLAGLSHPDHFLRTVPVGSPAWAEGFRAAFTGHVDTGLIQHEGGPVATFPLALNSAVLVGSDCIRLLAWLHAECETGGYLERRRRSWLAAVIDDGLDNGLFRRSAGWMDVAALLRGGSGEAVVVSVAGQRPIGTDADPDAPWAR